MSGQRGKVILVCGIDLGTSHSASCFYILNDSLDKMESGLSTEKDVTKVPSCLLLSKDLKNLVAFGTKAEGKYDPSKTVLFKHFKMNLWRDGDIVTKTPVVHSICGQYTLEATEAFRFVLRFFMDELKNIVEKWHTPLLWTEVMWVLTVPAIWSDGAKEVVRNAAKAAGLDLDNVRLCQEPLAASLYINYADKNVKELTPGTVALTVDCGGGTVDLCLYKVLPNARIEILRAANGGAWGGTYVDQNYLKSLQSIFGSVFDQWKKEHPEELAEDLNDFEDAKQHWTPVDSLTVSPTNLLAYYDEKEKPTVDWAKVLTEKNIERKRRKLIFSPSAAQALFLPNVSQILNLVTEELKACQTKCDIIHVVGGFARCEFVFQEIKKRFGGAQRVLLPPKPDIAIVVGATIFGWRCMTGNAFIENYILSHCWGQAVSCIFNPEVDKPNERRKDKDDEGNWRVHRFDCFITKDTSYKHDWRETRTYYPITSSQTAVRIEVYTAATPKERLSACRQLGFIDVDMPLDSNKANRALEVTFSLSDSEVIVSALHVKTKVVKVLPVNYLFE